MKKSAWLVIYATFPSEAGPSTVKSIIFRDLGGDFPFGIRPSRVAKDCFAIHAIVEIKAGINAPIVVIADQLAELPVGD